jgi:hypothetical protein
MNSLWKKVAQIPLFIFLLHICQIDKPKKVCKRSTCSFVILLAPPIDFKLVFIFFF